MPTHSLKDSIYSKLYNIAVSIIETVIKLIMIKTPVIPSTLFENSRLISALETLLISPSSHADQSNHTVNQQ